MNAFPELKEQLQSLMQIQEIDNELRELEEDRGELPEQIARLQKELDKTTALLWSNHQLIERVTQRKLDLTRDIEEARTRKRKFEDALYAVTSNKEYDSLTKELDEVQKLLGKRAEEQQHVQQELQKAETEHERIEKHLAKLKEEFEELQKELSEIVEDSSDRENELNTKRTAIEVKVTRPIYNHYQRIRLARDGRGIAKLVNGSCGGCYNSVPPQKQVEVRTYKDFILCEACGRVLVTDESVE